jgi:hypothetical protein
VTERKLSKGTTVDEPYYTEADREQHARDRPEALANGELVPLRVLTRWLITIADSEKREAALQRTERVIEAIRDRSPANACRIAGLPLTPVEEL